MIFLPSSRPTISPRSRAVSKNMRPNSQQPGGLRLRKGEPLSVELGFGGCDFSQRGADCRGDERLQVGDVAGLKLQAPISRILRSFFALLLTRSASVDWPRVGPALVEVSAAARYSISRSTFNRYLPVLRSDVLASFHLHGLHCAERPVETGQRFLYAGAGNRSQPGEERGG